MLPPSEDDAKKNLADHLFVYAEICHFTGPGGLASMGNVHNGCPCGGLHLAVATSPLFNAVKKEVQEKWQGIRAFFLKPGDIAPMDVEDRETIARLIRPPTDAFTPNVEDKMKEPSQWFAEWKDQVLAGREESHTLDDVMARLHDLVEHEAFPAYLQENPIPLKFFGKGSFIEKIKGNDDVWNLIVRETGREVTIQNLKTVYVDVCQEIRTMGGATPQELARKSQDMHEAMEQTKDALKQPQKRAEKMGVKAFGQRDMVRVEAEKSFNQWADGWFHRLKVIYLMHYLARRLPGEERLDSEIDDYSKYATEATKEVVAAPTHAALAGRIDVAKKDVISLLLDGEWTRMDAFVRARGAYDDYDDFVSKRVSEILDKLSNDATFDKTSFTPRFTGTISGFSPVFERNENDCTPAGTVKHICKHAGKVQKPTYKAVGDFARSFKTLKRDAKDNDFFDPFVPVGQLPILGKITPEDFIHANDCYFGEFDERRDGVRVPTTFLRMWLGVLALDKSLPKLMEQLYPLDTRTRIQDDAMQNETSDGGRDFVRLMNLCESVELGVVLGYLTKKMKAQTQSRIEGVHLKRKRDKQGGDDRDLVAWNAQQVDKFWKDKDLESIDARTLKNLIEWLREVNGLPESAPHLRFWNEQDWSPLTSKSFVFENEAFLTNLFDLEQYLWNQLDVQFDEFRHA